jgi:hypothetical protein
VENRRKSWLPVLLVLVAGAIGLGLGRLPSAAAAPEGGQLLLSSTIGATSAFVFVLDTGTRNLAAYETTPGENGGLRLLGARKIEHDLELAKYRDLSEFSFFDLRDKKNEAGQGDPKQRTQAGDRR